MFKIAKSIDVSNEFIDFNVVDVKIGKYENGESIYHIDKELEVFVSGNIDDDKYCVHFIIKKSIDEYFCLEKGKKYDIDSKNIIDSYVTINDNAYLDPMIDLDIIRLGDKFIFYAFFRDCEDDFFGISEFSVDLKQMLQC